MCYLCRQTPNLKQFYSLHLYNTRLTSSLLKVGHLQMGEGVKEGGVTEGGKIAREVAVDNVGVQD